MSKQDSRIYTNLSALLALREDSRHLSLSPRFRPAGMLSGRHASRIKGRGLNFEELRQYQAGDNIRQIDSRVSARLGKPYVRVYSEETDRPVHIVVDQRLPMFFGSQVNTKSVTAAQLAALLAWQVFDGGDRVGGAVIGCRGTVQMSPKRSSHNVIHLLEAIVTANNQLDLASLKNGKESTITSSLLSQVRPLVTTLNSQSVMILITDIEGVEIEELAELEVLSQKSNVLLFVIQDPLEDDLTAAHGLSVSHGEQQINIQASAQNQQKYDDLYQQRLASLKKATLTSALPVGLVNTYEPVITQLSRLLMGEPA
ncbi:DUF58 domain-containing protein [Shewanella sp. Choline-02u-19]|uniref:DUF58 domain-containing protein n=1 Tax=unclassified Shewanella TaxID=196818 RepID=UPI000C344DD7|nr:MULTISPECIES: DUF58 domain-containing protein [unclassified Shewanella]PKG55533.1 DUF58 domain-containing protein [Shewanella sp. GutDb-MelDb]PKG76301.1 DUF58 domain-containing protein [Shewanella sp. GutCb]PKH57418.1 DUF58 domain-containing protein [Shewanella sp. Bg11-22]PKI28281.1 DUF58 domain-containing protein [Shewanella sp. Choline-02u-19]